MKHVAIYCRVSSKKQDTKSQEPDLLKWAKAQDAPVIWYKDKFTGRTMNRPGWKKLEAEIHQGHVSAIVCWRIDRLGRTVSGLSSLFDLLLDRKINLVSLRDGLDLSTPAGRLVANIQASQAAYFSETLSENILAGQAVARKAGKTWGGSLPGVHKVVTPLQLRLVRDMKEKGEAITDIAKAVRLSRPTIYAILQK